MSVIHKFIKKEEEEEEVNEGLGNTEVVSTLHWFIFYIIISYCLIDSLDLSILYNFNLHINISKLNIIWFCVVHIHLATIYNILVSFRYLLICIFVEIEFGFVDTSPPHLDFYMLELQKPNIYIP